MTTEVAVTLDRDRGNPDALRNWAGNVTFSASRLLRPRSVGELQDIVAGAGRLKAVGTGHSFSTVADTVGELVTVADLPRMVAVDAEAATVTVSAGLRWGELAPELHAAGFAVHTLGSLPHISVAGSVATGTHGSGDGNGCLATAVSALDLVVPSGDVVRIARGDEGFDGSVVALGALGIVTSVTLDVEPTYDVAQVVYDDLPWDRALHHIDEVMGAAMSVSLFTTWRGAGFEQVWVKQRIGDPAADLAWTGAVAADGPRHPVPGASADFCTQQGGVPGPWFERVPHFRLEFTPSSGEELQTEYLVPREHGADALRALDSIRELVAPVLQISEIRTVAGDTLWLSPAYGRDSLALHFTWVADTARVLPVVLEVERVLAPYDARPHWGKVFSPSPVGDQYPRIAEFRALAQGYDPDGKLGNDFLDSCVLAASDR
jgi:alditol oxidase